MAKTRHSLFKRLRSSSVIWHRARPNLEPLELRQMLSTVNSINPTSGSWDVASNWSTDTVPGPDDDVVINEPGSPTVTVGSNAESVHSITAADPLVISGGGEIDVAGGMTINPNSPLPG